MSNNVQRNIRVVEIVKIWRTQEQRDIAAGRDPSLARSSAERWEKKLTQYAEKTAT